MNQRTPTLIPIPLGMVKTFLIVGERAILVDAGIPGSERRILGALARAGVEPQGISLILITHSHADHFGAVPALRGRTGAQVAIHRAAAEALRLGISAEVRPAGLLGRLFTLLPLGAGAHEGIEPDVVIEDELDLNDYGVDGKVIHTPGHTPGSVSVHLTSGEAIVGDLIMGGIPFRRAPQHPFFATDLVQVRESVQRVLALGPHTIHASHGGPFTPEAVRKKFRA